jgi:protein-S-isoprenylcysteine O-methyltransferase Ste14
MAGHNFGIPPNHSIMPTSTINFLQWTSYSWILLLFVWFYTGLKTKITVRREKLSSRIIYLSLVICGFAFVYYQPLAQGFLALRFLPSTPVVSYIGLLINVAGILFSIYARFTLGSNWSATVTLKQDHELIQTGPYSITRHPIYTGFLFGLAGAVVVLGEVRGWIGWVLLLLAMDIKAGKEEEFMKSHFAQYAGYRKKVRKFIPFIY